MPPKCPYCNIELEYEERMRDQNEGDYYYETWRGYCPKCNKTFQMKCIISHVVTVQKK